MNAFGVSPLFSVEGRGRESVVPRLTGAQLYGSVVFSSFGVSRFVVHKTSDHVFGGFDSFGISESRLLEMARSGVREVHIIFHESDGSQVLYKTTISRWLKGLRRVNGSGSFSRPDVQRHIQRGACEVFC